MTDLLSIDEKDDIMTPRKLIFHCNKLHERYNNGVKTITIKSVCYPVVVGVSLSVRTTTLVIGVHNPDHLFYSEVKNANLQTNIF